jgi:hypothetical protein
MPIAFQCRSPIRKKRFSDGAERQTPPEFLRLQRVQDGGDYRFPHGSSCHAFHSAQAGEPISANDRFRPRCDKNGNVEFRFA